MQLIKGRYLVIFILIISCVNKKEIFNRVNDYESIYQIRLLKEDGFYGLKETIYYDKLRFKRFIYIYQNKIIIDGYFGKQSDSILLIPYQTVYQSCKIQPLIFCVLNKKEPHYIGNSCVKLESFNVQTDILVKYDTTYLNKNNLYFTHNMVSENDWVGEEASSNDFNSFIETRYYYINLVTGLKIDSIATYDIKGLYWWNY